MGYELVSRSRRTIAGSLLGLGLLAAPLAATLAAEVSVGAGLRTSFTVTDLDGAEGGTESAFAVDSARLYISGKVTDQIGFMFNTAFKKGDDGSEVGVMDAAAQFTFSDQFNIWAGRFLAPSDRANLYGPYYGSNWGFAIDGVQDGYPMVMEGTGVITDGRSDGAMYWGQFGITKVSAGVFHNDGSGNGDLKGAARVQVDLWDPEGGYYLNGSYYGAKDLLAFGVAAQTSSGDTAFSVDALMEKKLAGGGVVTLEAEYADYEDYGGYYGDKGYYALAAYLFPQQVGIGKFQVLGKYGTTKYDGGPDLDTAEFNLNYIIKDQNARLQLFYIDRDGYAKVYGLGLQIQM
jgi:hypothetical protein